MENRKRNIQMNRQDIEDIKKAVDEIWRLQRRTLLNQP